MREWKAGYEAVNRITNAEKLNRSPKERMRLAQAFAEDLDRMGLLLPREDNIEFHLRWQAVREKWVERNS